MSSNRNQLRGILQYASDEENRGMVLAINPHPIQNAEIRALFSNPQAVRIYSLTAEDFHHLSPPITILQIFMGSPLSTVPPQDLTAFSEFVTWNAPFVEYAAISLVEDRIINTVINLMPALEALCVLQLRLRTPYATDYAQIHLSRRNADGGFDSVGLSMFFINHTVEITTVPEYIDLGLQVLSKVADVQIREPGRTKVVLRSRSFDPVSIQCHGIADDDMSAILQVYRSCFP
ncbi:hypothetical protein K435DRAFT_779224 [Dendrothele bispora CBS 962.96]|uniref:Uncharacterized protein n=1 Tax=Dendrothele bispora (strain CBS 962.96) TaxID=1314807 RepID=A0A4S8LZ83_DENBC|nr:hypothetical protein K435DRAFT_779224 [Dendrothele bispora CBS 962.96]